MSFRPNVSELYCWERNGEIMTSKVVVLLSGGMDSCVTAAIAAEQHGAERLALVHASYGQRTEQRERRAFDDIAGFMGCVNGLWCASTISRGLAARRLPMPASPFRSMPGLRRFPGARFPSPTSRFATHISCLWR